MNTNDYAELYQAKGFFWNECLSEFVSELAGKELFYRRHQTGDTRIARFCRLVWIGVGRGLSHGRQVADFLGEEAAPVGDCDGQQVELFLSTNGRFIGLSDSRFLEWGDLRADWRTAVRNLLDGEEPKIIGEIKSKTMQLNAR